MGLNKCETALCAQVATAGLGTCSEGDLLHMLRARASPPRVSKGGLEEKKEEDLGLARLPLLGLAGRGGGEKEIHEKSEPKNWSRICQIQYEHAP